MQYRIDGLFETFNIHRDKNEEIKSRLKAVIFQKSANEK
jgi:hypothetical protein